MNSHEYKQAYYNLFSGSYLFNLEKQKRFFQILEINILQSLSY